MRALALLTALLLVACGRGPLREGRSPRSPARETSPVAAGWDELSADYLEATFERDPGFAVGQGRHEYDGRIIDWSRPARERWVAQLMEFRARTEQFAPSELDAPRAFERRYLQAVIDAELFRLTRLKEHERSPLVYAQAIDPAVYVAREYAPLETRLAALTKHAHNIPAVVDAMIENLRTPLPETFLEVGLATIGGLAPYLRDDVPKVFAGVRDPALVAAYREASAVAIGAIERARTFLEGERAGANADFALGPTLFSELLWATERVDLPLSELRALGQRDLRENLAALSEACAELAPKSTLSACAEDVLKQKPALGPVASAERQLAMLEQFVRERGFVSIPGGERAQVAEAPPHKRWNQAFIEIPGPYERGLPSIYYIAPPDPAWDERERAAYVPGEFDLLFISAHEVWPGHFLQFLHANRAPRALGRVFVGYAFAEGWAHYAESLVIEEGLFAKDARARVGQLLNALLRNVRFVSALGLHTEGMNVAESERLFREQAFCDPGNARQQAARGTFDPAYLSYTLGKLMIRDLRDAWTKSRGGRTAYRAFHDRLLSLGGPPVGLLREVMLADDAR